MADNYLEKKMEEFRNRPMTSGSNRKAVTPLNKLLTRNRSYSHFDSKVIVRMEHLKSITGVCGKIEFLGGMTPEDFSFEYKFDDDTAQIIIKTNSYIANIAYINLGILLQSMLLRATEMGLNGNCIQIEEKGDSSAREIEAAIIIGKGIDSHS